METDCWIYRGECLESPPEGAYGFVYIITDDVGKQYYGKKAFTHNRKAKLSARTKKKLGTRKIYEQKKVDSKWNSYWGSCKELLEYIAERGNTDGFTREILKICENKQSLTYWEAAYMIKENVIFRKDTWNSNILGKFFKNKIHE